MKMLGGKRERNKQANRESILAAARSCFLEKGYDAVTIRDVIRRSGLASGTFYNYFPDKESVFRAMVEGRLQILQERMHQARSQASDIESFFYCAFMAAFEQARADPDFFELMYRNEAVVRSLYHDNLFGLLMQSLKNDLEDAIARGVVPRLDADILTAISFGAGYELVRLMVNDLERDPEKTARFAARVFTQGVPTVPPKLIRMGSRLLRGAAR